MDLGLGKSATAHMIQSAASAYADRGFKYVVPLFSLQSTSRVLTSSRFYYADERKMDGAPAFRDIDGPAHGEYYVKLSEGTTQEPWQQTFVKGVGYKSFRGQ